jgi:hypothetical protein
MFFSEALKLARDNVFPLRHGAQWVVTAPYKHIGGPTQHSIPEAFSSALRTTAIRRAELALELLGYDEHTQWAAAYDVEQGQHWVGVVRKYSR